MPTPKPRTSTRATFAVLAIGTGAYSLLQSLVSPILPQLQIELHTTQNSVTWVLTAYLLAASVFTPIIGRVGDIVGKEKVLVCVLVAVALGSALAAVSTSIGWMIAARSIQGAGGGIIPLAFGIIRDEFPRQKVAGAVGAIAALLAVGSGLGLVLAGPIVRVLDYHWLFWFPAIVVAVAAVVTHFVVPPSPVRSEGRVSWTPALLLSAWLVALLVGISQAPTWGWGSAPVIGLLALSVVFVIAWILVELKFTAPLIDMRMMRIPAVWTTNLVALLFGAGMYATFAFIPEFLQTPTSVGYGFGATVTTSGLIALPMSVTMFFFGTWSAPLSRRFGAKAVLVAGSGVTVVPFAIMAFAHDEIWQLLVAMMLLGVGFGLAFSAMANIIVDSVPTHQTGVASGMNANIRTIGGAIGAAVMASIITAGVPSDAVPKESGYTIAFAMLAVVLAFATIAGLLIPKATIERDEHQQEQAAMAHAELAIVAGGTIVGDEPE